MQLLNETVNFLQERSTGELFRFFWFFFVFDFTRYVLTDSVLLMVFLWRRRRQHHARRLARAVLFHENPLVSIIAPGKNEGRHIPRLAASLRAQTYKNIEIIIVDDGSEDNTPAILRHLRRTGAINKAFRNEIRGGKASAANLALCYAKGKFVIHLDADSHLKADAVEQILLPFYMDETVGAVGGDLRVNNITEGLSTSLQAIDYMKSISTGRAVTSMLGILRIVSGAHGAFRRDLLQRVKGWDVGPGLDGDLTLKMRKIGYKVIQEPGAVCYTNVPNSFWKLARQRYRWDRSLVRFRLRKHRDLLSFSHRNFRLFNFLAIVDNIVFNLLLNVKWWIYTFQVVFFETEFLPFIFITNYGLYILANLIEFFFVILVFGRSMRKQELQLFFFLPLMPLYTGFFLRLIRSYAYLMELIHKVSFEDRWNPWKVSKVVKHTEMGS